jgi:hypothetical protein
VKHPVVHFEVVGNDKETLYGFYRELFEWEIEDVPLPEGSYGLVAADQEAGQIGGGIGATSGEGHVTWYVQVDDVEAALAKAEELGGTRLMGPVSPAPETVIGLFADPEGHMIGVTGS